MTDPPKDTNAPRIPQPQDVRLIVAEDIRTPRAAFRNLEANTGILGITNGSWDKIDALAELLLISGPSKVAISTWTAAGAHIQQAQRMIHSRLITDLRLMVDRSFLSRQPEYCATARLVFGDESIRVWNSHAKFIVLEPRDGPNIVYLTSANLNQNKRIENFQLFCSDRIANEYLALVDRIFDLQSSGEGFRSTTSGRRHTNLLFA